MRPYIGIRRGWELESVEYGWLTTAYRFKCLRNGIVLTVRGFWMSALQALDELEDLAPDVESLVPPRWLG